MPQENYSVKVFPVLLIKDEIKKIAYDFRFHPTDVSSETWNRPHTCKLNEMSKCRDYCKGTVSFLVNNAPKNIKFIHVYFFRKNNTAYVLYDHNVRKMFENNISMQDHLVTINILR